MRKLLVRAEAGRAYLQRATEPSPRRAYKLGWAGLSEPSLGNELKRAEPNRAYHTSQAKPMQAYLSRLSEPSLGEPRIRYLVPGRVGVWGPLWCTGHCQNGRDESCWRAGVAITVTAAAVTSFRTRRVLQMLIAAVLYNMDALGVGPMLKTCILAKWTHWGLTQALPHDKRVCLFAICKWLLARPFAREAGSPRAVPRG